MRNNTFNPRLNLHPSHQIHQYPSQIPHNFSVNNTYDHIYSPQFQYSNPSINHHHHHQPYYSDYETRLRDEVIYLHSLWHRGPPSTLNPNLRPSTSTPFKKKKKKKKPKTLNPQLVSDKEWPIEPKPTCPSPPGSAWPEFKPKSGPVCHPATAEERARVLSVKIHLKGLDSCSGLFHKPSDESSDDDEDEDDDFDDDDDEEFEFFLKVFEGDGELRGYYENKCENGEFYCLVCGVLGNKLGRKYKNCVALVQHSITVSKTKKKKAHRAYGHVICKVLGWDVNRLPTLPSSVGDTSGQSLEKFYEPQGEVKNHADECKDNPAVVERGGDSANASPSQAERKDISIAVGKDNMGSKDAGCSASEVTHSESEGKGNLFGFEVDGLDGFKKDEVCNNSENVQSEQEYTPVSVQEIANKRGEGCSTFDRESTDSGMS